MDKGCVGQIAIVILAAIIMRLTGVSLWWLAAIIFLILLEPESK